MSRVFHADFTNFTIDEMKMGYISLLKKKGGRYIAHPPA
jgi:hypothetical protein